jgi:hypothetical protein
MYYYRLQINWVFLKKIIKKNIYSRPAVFNLRYPRTHVPTEVLEDILGGMQKRLMDNIKSKKEIVITTE